MIGQRGMDHQQVVVGDYQTAKTGNGAGARATSGIGGQSYAGRYGTACCGDHGRAFVDVYGKIRTGNDCLAVAGAGASINVGAHCTVILHDYGTVTAGDQTTLITIVDDKYVFRLTAAKSPCDKMLIFKAVTLHNVSTSLLTDRLVTTQAKGDGTMEIILNPVHFDRSFAVKFDDGSYLSQLGDGHSTSSLDQALLFESADEALVVWEDISSRYGSGDTAIAITVVEV